MKQLSPLWAWSATDLADAIASREIRSVDVTTAALERVRDHDDVHAFVYVAEESALAAAESADRAVAAGESTGPLHGVPIAIKDLEATCGMPTTSGSPALRDRVPTADALIVERLRRAGAVIVGKTNTPEFGHKSFTDNPLFGPTSTPFDLKSNAGGSSGGAAAAVGAGLVPLAQGGDGGGSIRIPAALCGVVGVKPSFGLIPNASSPNAFLAPPFVSMGPLARTVADAALFVDAVSGPDSRDPFALPPMPMRLAEAVGRPIAGMRIGYSSDLGVFDVDPDVAAVSRSAVAALAEAGAEVEEVSFGLRGTAMEYALSWRTEVAVKYAGTYRLLRAQGIDLLEPESGTSPYFCEMIRRGLDASATEFDAVGVMKSEVLAAVESVFERFDLLVTPTSGVAAVPNRPGGGSSVDEDAIDDARANPLSGRTLAFLFNMTGHPAASVPAGLTAAGSPVGLQIVGRRWSDDSVFAACAALERIRPWPKLPFQSQIERTFNA